MSVHLQCEAETKQLFWELFCFLRCRLMHCGQLCAPVKSIILHLTFCLRLHVPFQIALSMQQVLSHYRSSH